MDVRGHCDLASILVLRGAGFQAYRPCGNVDLPHLKVDEFADSPPICSAHLDYRLEPEIGAVCDQLLVLCVFEEAGTDIVFSQLGNLKLKMDSGREVEFNARQHPHLDYGYAVTSHSSQGQTADRVLIHVDSEQAHGELLNSRMAYVSVSRAQYDVQMYTNDAATLGQELSRDVSKSVALEDVTIAKSLDSQPVQQIVEQLGLGLSL